MAFSIRQRLITALTSHPDIKPHIAHQILTQVIGATRNANPAVQQATKDSAWLALLGEVRKHRRSIQANRDKWNPLLVELYTEYMAILDKVILRMQSAQTKGLAVEDVTRAAAQHNKAHPENPIGLCTAVWQTWVPSHVRADLINRVDVAYARSDMTKGNRFLPFRTPSDRRTHTRRVRIMRDSIRRVREQCAARSAAGLENFAHTPYKALYLCALRMAERELDRRVKGYQMGTIDMFDVPLSANWRHLLTPEMRRELRLADDNPAGINPHGLKGFYKPAGETESTHEPIPLDDVEGDIEDEPPRVNEEPVRYRLQTPPDDIDAYYTLEGWCFRDLCEEDVAYLVRLGFECRDGVVVNVAQTLLGFDADDLDVTDQMVSNALIDLINGD